MPWPMRKLSTVAVFVAAVALAIVAFNPVGNAAGELAYRAFAAYGQQGASVETSALAALIGVDIAALVLVFGLSFLGGVRLPSGLPHAFAVLFVPLMLGVMQARFFALAEEAGSLAEAFGAYNFAIMFVVSFAAAQLGVYMARRRHEARERGSGVTSNN